MAFASRSIRSFTQASLEGSPLLGESKPKLLVPVEEDVYSAILYLPAMARIETGTEYSRGLRLALVLCAMNAIMQIGVVQIINVYNTGGRREEMQNLIALDHVAHGKGNRAEIMQEAHQDHHISLSEKIHMWMLPEHEREQYDEVSLIKPLCARTFDANDTEHFTCMTQSLQFTQEWETLDIDGDGMWSLQEAKNDTAGLGKKYGVSPETVFHNAIDGLRMHGMDGLFSNHSFYLSQDVKFGNALPKAYFNYWTGDAMLCSLFDGTSCEVAAKEGFFAEALRPGRVSANSKGILDLESALQYCHKMLERNGGCETVMPLDWKRHREQRRDQCGRRELVDEGTKYVNPFDANQVVNVLKRRFQMADQAEDAASPLFLIFLTLIIMLWLLSVISEWRALLKKLEFLMLFPGIAEDNTTGHISRSASNDGDPEDHPNVYHITGLSPPHRAVLVVVWTLRVGVVLVLTQFGVQFLLVETNYLNLVLNSLALTFILSIDNMLFEMVESSTRAQMKCCKDIKFETRFNGYWLKKECWGVFVVPIVAVLIVAQCTYEYKLPIIAALQCACQQEGPQCLDSIQSQVGWWNVYWNHTLPAAMHQIEAMRLSGA